MQPPSTKAATVNARIAPAAGLDVLSRQEVARLRDVGDGTGGLHELLRRCALAVLTQGGASDDARALLDRYPDFDIQILQQDRGVKLELTKAPAEAFVKMTSCVSGANGPPDGPVKRNFCGTITSGSLTFNVKKREWPT